MSRVVLDTNVLLSGLINPQGMPASILTAWHRRRFELVTSAEQLLELGNVARRPALRVRIVPATVAQFIDDLRELALVVQRLSARTLAPDPADNFLLAMAAVADADFLVSGDRPGVMRLRGQTRTAILGVRAYWATLERT